MQRKRTVYLNFNAIKPHLPIIICFSVFGLGVLLGCLLVGNIGFFKEYFSEQLTAFKAVRAEKVLTDILIDSFKNVFPLYLLVFLVGTSVVGCALAPLIVLWYGFSYGGISGILYSSYGLEGIMFNALIYIPPVLLCAFGLAILLKNAISFSYLLSGICIRLNKPVNIYSNFKEYCLRGAVTLFAALASLLFDTAMSALFIGYFSI